MTDQEAPPDVEGLPDDCADQEAALGKQGVATLKNMLREVDLPICGSKGELVVRLIRHLRGLPPTTADAKLYDYMEKQAAKRKKKGAGKGRGSSESAPDTEAAARTNAEVTARKTAEEAARKAAAEAARKAAQEAEAAASAKAQEYAEKKRLKKEKKIKKQENREEVAAAAAAMADAAASRETKPVGEQVQAPPEEVQQEEPPSKKQRMEAAAPVEASQGDAGEPLVTNAESACMELALPMGPQALEESAAPEPDHSDEEMEGEGDPGALIVELEGVAASRLQADGGRWKRHFEAVTGASLELSVDPKAGESSHSLRTGLAVTVSGVRKRPLRQYNGRLGRILSKEDGCWHVRLACGAQDRFPSDNLTPRAAGFWGEVWLRTSFEESKRASGSRTMAPAQVDPAQRLLADLTKEDEIEQPYLQRLHALLASIQCKSLSVSVAPHATEGVTVLRIPAAAVRHLRALGAKALMSEFRVVAAVVDLESSGANGASTSAKTSGSEQLKSLLANLGTGQLVEAHNGSERWREAVVLGPSPEDSSEYRLRWCLDGVEDKISKRHIRVPSPVNDDAWLVMYGEARGRRGAELKAMGAAERAAPGFFSSQPPPHDGGPEDPLGILRVPLTAPGGVQPEDSVAKRAARVATASGAMVQLVGPDALVCGTSTQRLDAAALLGVARSASQDAEVVAVPENLNAFCARLRVPQVAWKVAAALPTIEREHGVTGLWVGPSEEQDDDEPEEEQDIVLRRGMPVSVIYEDGSSYEAAVVSIDEDAAMVTVQWPEDGSKTKLHAHRVRPKAEEANKQAKKNRAWLRNPWVLALFGPLRQRKTAALSVLQACEGVCPGLWSSEVVDVLDELRGGPNEDCSISIEAKPLVGEGMDPLFATLAEKKGRPLIRRAALASSCGIQTLGNKAKKCGMFFVGNSEERKRGLEYLRWAVAEDRALVEQLATDNVTDADWDEADDEGSEPSARSFANEFRKVRKSRDDVFCIVSTAGTTCWLEPAHLRDIERETNTLILVDHGYVGNDWTPTALAEIHICGADDERRTSSRALVEAKLAEIASQVEETPDVENATEVEEPAKKKPKKGHSDKTTAWDGGKLMGAAQALSEQAPSSAPGSGKQTIDSGRRQAEGTAQVADPVTAPVAAQVAAALPASAAVPAVPLQPTNPLAELRKLPSWPLDTAAWAQVQDIVWANHPLLAKGWVRIWSRSKDMEYYFRMQDGKTTFKLSEAMAQ